MLCVLCCVHVCALFVNVEPLIMIMSHCPTLLCVCESLLKAKIVFAPFFLFRIPNSHQTRLKMVEKGVFHRKLRDKHDHKPFVRKRSFADTQHDQSLVLTHSFAFKLNKPTQNRDTAMSRSLRYLTLSVFQYSLYAYWSSSSKSTG